ncbi:MAG: hypothetical protein HKN44_06795 [Ilumatobacter sp.]|nr:hypothetical protein [Ilumatobacter sp.]
MAPSVGAGSDEFARDDSSPDDTPPTLAADAVKRVGPADLDPPPAVQQPQQQPPATAPPITLPDRPLRVLIIGDSVPESLKPTPDEPRHLDAYGPVVVRNEGRVACPALRVGRWKLEGMFIDDPEFCAGDDRFASAVAEFDPDVLFVLFGWPARGEGRFLDDGSVISPCDPAFDGPWADELELVARRFEADTRVVVSNVAPPGLEFSWDSAGAECLNAALADRNVVIFDFAEWLCPAGDCSAFDALRPDAVHFGAADEIRLPVLDAVAGHALATAGYPPRRLSVAVD